MWVYFSTLVNLFLYNIDFPQGRKSRCPSSADFIAQVFPQLEELQATVLREVAAGIYSAGNTDPGISPDSVTSGDGISASSDISVAGNPADAGISTAAVGNAGGGVESPMSEKGSPGGTDDVGMMGLEQLKLRSSEDEVIMTGAEQNGTVDNDEVKKRLINVSKTCESLSRSYTVYIRS